MRALGDRLFGLCCLGLTLAGACSVFPDSAVLPVIEAEGGGAGSMSPQGGAPAADAGESGVVPSGGTARGGAEAGGSAAATAGAGGVPQAEAGAGGLGGEGGSVERSCASPQFVSRPVSVDLWIGSTAPDAPHEGESLLYVSGGPDERRTLLGLDLPAAPMGAVLLKAELVLPLVGNADANKAARKLALHLLSNANVPNPKKTSWTHFDAGNKGIWEKQGGDLQSDEPVAEAQVAAGTTSGRVAFEVTEVTRAALRPQGYLVSVVVLERAQLTPPAALAFTSLEGNASGSAVLELTFCPP